MSRQVQISLILAAIVMSGFEMNWEESATRAAAGEKFEHQSPERSADLLKGAWKSRQLLEVSSGRVAASGDPVWSADGRRVAFEQPLGSYRRLRTARRGVGVLDILTGECRAIPMLPAPVTWHPDGKRLLAMGPGGLWAVERDGDTHKADLLIADVTQVLSVSPGGSFLFCAVMAGEQSRRWMVVDLQGNSLAVLNDSEASAWAWSQDERQLFCGGSEIHRIDLPNGGTEMLFSVGDCPKSLLPAGELPPTASPPGASAGCSAAPSWRLAPIVALKDGRLVAQVTYGRAGTVFIWQRKDGKDHFKSLGDIWRGEPNGSFEGCSSFIPVGNSGLLLRWEIARKEDRKDLSGSVFLLDAATGKRLDLELPLELYRERGVLSRDGRTAAFILHGDLIMLDTVTGRSQTVRLPVKASRMSFSPDSSLLAINGYLNTNDINGLGNGNSMMSRVGSVWLFNREGRGVAYLPVSGEAAQTSEPLVGMEVGLLLQEADEVVADVTRRRELEDVATSRDRLRWGSLCLLYCAERLQDLGRANEADRLRKQVDGLLDSESRSEIIAHLTETARRPVSYIKARLPEAQSIHEKRNLVHNLRMVRRCIEDLELLGAHAEAKPLQEVISEAEAPIKAMEQELRNERNRMIKAAYERKLHQ